ncbi:hypothetical protein M427DRAFT_92918 [Gonapodya prolifera JEL478]|uniref:DDE Tnp4 domain-containing protein n=1 Tax=Gonapodya prolifera (strain JEL478) TaxID=1344416 RepID=A0A139AZL1_GONPJ|nr:hypothetical protein M427DRAFT_92918 [Gonapodya prolifera JEL478]|eukprot:KXS22147.1 hypothetical protein M427DRAFT_92918 [Gonapodya prolifera JEL478]
MIPPERPLYLNTRLNLNFMSNADCLLSFCFKKEDIICLRTDLELPVVVVLDGCHMFLGVEALSLLLKQLAFPNCLSDLLETFGPSPGELLWIVLYRVRNLKEQYMEILRWDADWLMPQLLKQFCGAIHEAGLPLVSVFRFIDGMDCRILWPLHNQRKYYSGRKRQHCLKYQGMVSVDESIIHLAGPFLSPDHDLTIFQRSGLNKLLALYGTCATQPRGAP